MVSSKQYRQKARKYLAQKNAEVGREFVEVPRHQWPMVQVEPVPARVLRNNQFLVQEFTEPGGVIRLSINRTAVKGFRKDNSSIWQEGITWDEMQAIKAALGYQSRWAVELFPPDEKVVNVSNMRHLWLLPEPPNYGWHKGGQNA